MEACGDSAVATPVIGFCLSAVVLLPWLEIAKYAAHHVTSPAASLRPIDLAAVMSADYFGLISGDYRGPEEIRQFYLYGGLLLLPLAIAGLLRKLQMASILALIVPGLWYAFGPAAGFARVLQMLPVFRDAHAPIEIWFVPALGFALAAGSGAAWAAEKMGQKRLPFILMVIIAADLWHFNMYKSPLVYASSITFEDLYAKRQENFEARIREVKQQPFYRLWMSNPSIAIGPLDGSLVARTEVSWGAGLLELNRYAEYARAIASNPRLLHGLSANYLVDPRGRLEVNPSALPRVSVPPRITSGAYAELASLDPAQGSVVEGLTKKRDSAAALGADGHRLSRGFLSDPLFRSGRDAHPHRGAFRARMDRRRGRDAGHRAAGRLCAQRRHGSCRATPTDAAIPSGALPAWCCAEHRCGDRNGCSFFCIVRSEVCESALPF